MVIMNSGIKEEEVGIWIDHTFDLLLLLTLRMKGIREVVDTPRFCGLLLPAGNFALVASISTDFLLSLS